MEPKNLVSFVHVEKAQPNQLATKMVQFCQNSKTRQSRMPVSLPLLPQSLFSLTTLLLACLLAYLPASVLIQNENMSVIPEAAAAAAAAAGCYPFGGAPFLRDQIKPPP